MHHRVIGDISDKFIQLRLRWQVSVQQQVADFHERALGRQILDIVTTVHQDTLIPVNIGQA